MVCGIFFSRKEKIRGKGKKGGNGRDRREEGRQAGIYFFRVRARPCPTTARSPRGLRYPRYQNPAQAPITVKISCGAGKRAGAYGVWNFFPHKEEIRGKGKKGEQGRGRRRKEARRGFISSRSPLPRGECIGEEASK